MEITEENTNKIYIAGKIDPAVAAAVQKIAADDDRTVSNTLDRLLKTHPRVKKNLEAETVAVGA